MATVDYNALRAQTMGSGNDEEAVTVNTRALIDKVLARYSGEWTVLRELLQNAADASASQVVIKFETAPSASIPVPSSTNSSTILKHVLRNHTLTRLLVTNNGHNFADSDWARLKRIAEGNPDETKIGAFGVGFYSVFADCEEPFVSSGDQAMAFYWKGNSLFTRKSQLPADQSHANTSFVLDYRAKTNPVPNLLILCQFLATSLTFVGLDKIELHVDSWKVLTLNKKRPPPHDIPLPRSIETKTQEGTFTVQRVEQQNVQIDAQAMKIVTWKPSQGLSISAITSVFSGNDRSREPNSNAIRNWFTRLTAPPPAPTKQKKQDAPQVAVNLAEDEDLTAYNSATIFLSMGTAHLKTAVAPNFFKELERATKKPPPKFTTLSILTSSYEESVATEASTSDGAEVFAGVLPSKSGRIYIGFPTHQTTGSLAHISAHSLIPTVERESIDMNARWVRTWNVELLRAAGILCRLTWASEMDSIQKRLFAEFKSTGKSKIPLDLITKMTPHAVHVFQQFTYRNSTPLSEVSSIIEEAFWTSSKTASIELYSTQGILPSSQVRISREDLSFVSGIPRLPDDLIAEAGTFVDKLKEFSLVTAVTNEDVLSSLRSNALDEKQLRDFLKWISRKVRSGELSNRARNDLLGAAIASTTSTVDSSQNSLIVLSTIENFVLPNRLAADLPMPPSTMPFSFTKSLSKDELEALGWEELHIVPWLQFLLGVNGANGLPDAQQMTLSPTIAGKVLAVMSRQWDKLGDLSQKAIIQMVSERTIIPTKQGMKSPKTTYFPSVKLFPDLPILMPLQGVKENFLVALGVRKTIEIGLIFDRLLSTQTGDKASETQGKWSHVDLIKYLTSVRHDIPKEDIRRLYKTPICPANVDGKPSTQLYEVSALFRPEQIHRDMKLPIIFWPDDLQSWSKEAKFLISLGLREHPSVEEILSVLMSSFRAGDLALREKTLAYFLKNWESNNYESSKLPSTAAFLPLEDDPQAVASPGNCFTNKGALSLGFHILRRDLHAHRYKFGVDEDPPIAACFDRIVAKPPQTTRDARIQFSYLSQRLNSIVGVTAAKFGAARIVPVPSQIKPEKSQLQDGTQSVQMISPNSCYLGISDTWQKMFNFVDFGEDANTFLLKCGAKHEPTKLEIAKLLSSEPKRLLEQLGGIEKYMEVLRALSESAASLRKERQLWKEMKSSPFLLAYREIPDDKKKTNGTLTKLIDFGDDDEEEDVGGIKEYSLSTAAEIVVVNDLFSYTKFKDHLLVCPQEETLEDFYLLLGSNLLSDRVQEETRIGPLAENQRPASSLRKLVLERSRLFLHEHPKTQIKYDAQWLEKNLKVKTVKSVKLVRRLKGRTIQDTETRTAAVSSGKEGHIMWVVYTGVDLFHVSQALVNLLLIRPKPSSANLLTNLLETDLLRLRSRGYNVDRILRSRAAEARIVEQTRKQAAEEEARKQLESRQKLLEGPGSPIRNQAPKMPGGFDSPDNSSPPPYDDSLIDQSASSEAQGASVAQKPKSILSSLSKRFRGNAGEGPSSTVFDSDTGVTGPQTPQTQPTRPDLLRSTIAKALMASRPHNSDSVFSRPSTTPIQEQSTYCDSTTGHDIKLIDTIEPIYTTSSNARMKFFTERAIPLEESKTYLRENHHVFATFVSLLRSIARVYGIDPSTLNIFNDRAGSTIAFNYAGSLFANFRYFYNLHWLGGLNKPDQPNADEAFIYWWVVIAHELAHNLVERHDAAHSYYTENIVAEYFPKAAIGAKAWATVMKEVYQSRR